MEKVTNITSLKKDLEKSKAALPQHWNDSVIEMRQGDLDYLINKIALLSDKLDRLEAKNWVALEELKIEVDKLKK